MLGIRIINIEFSNRIRELDPSPSRKSSQPRVGA